MFNIPQMYILFWFRKSEAKKEVMLRNRPAHDTLGSICCRITFDGQSVEVGNVHIECRKSVWDAENQRIIGTDTNTKRQNRTLMELRLKLDRVYEMLMIEYSGEVKAAMVKDFFTGKRVFRYTFEQLIREYFVDRRLVMAVGQITESTLDVQLNYSRNFEAFLEKSKYKGLSPQSFEEDKMDEFQLFLIIDKMGPAHTRKHLFWVKALFKHSLKKKRLKSNPVIDYEIGADGVIPDTSHLTVDQLKRLAEFDFDALVRQGYIQQATADKCDRERDAFVFNCFTGMHHCDYTDKAFRIEHYQDAVFLKGYRRKTKKEFMVKLLEPALQVLNKYEGKIENLPSKSNQKRNDALKQMAILVNIPLLLSTKIARKTFADIALNELMMDTSDVQACLGLTSGRYLAHYVKLREKRLMKKMSSWNDVLKTS